jgi:hypothetical protein
MHSPEVGSNIRFETFFRIKQIRAVTVADALAGDAGNGGYMGHGAAG